jgi:hypothetical protein
VNSILQFKETNYYIFIIDNSNDKSKQNWFVKQLSANNDHVVIVNESEFDIVKTRNKVTVINAKNRGFAAANNIVLRQIISAKGYDYVWLLNNDTIVREDTLRQYTNAFQITSKNKKLGILGCVLVYASQPEVIQAVGGIYYKFLGTSKHVCDGQKIETYRQEEKKRIDYPVGASMLISPDFLSDVGVMEESYFLYFEELDWCIRARKKGWAIDYAPDIFIQHKAGQTIGGKNSLKKRSSEISDYYFYRNRLIFSKKYTPFHFPFVVITVLTTIIYRIVTGRSAFLRLFIRKNQLSPVN